VTAKLAADEAEQRRGEKCDVTRHEFEALLGVLGLSGVSVENAMRQKRAMDHLDEVKRRGHERVAAEDAREPERLRLLDEERERAVAKREALAQRWATKN
jgi:hypothetical protein